MAKKKVRKRLVKGRDWQGWAWETDQGEIIGTFCPEKPDRDSTEWYTRRFGGGDWVKVKLVKAALCLALLLLPGCALLPEIAKHTLVWGIQRLARPAQVETAPPATQEFLLDIWIPSQNDPWSCSPNPEFLWMLLYGEPMAPARYVRCERCDDHYAKGEEHECRLD